MSDIFLKLLNMSLTASWLVLAVVILRFAFKKAPKWISCVLWGIVGLRLIMPFSLESVLSLIPSPEPIPQNIAYQSVPSINSGIPVINNTVNPVINQTFAPDVTESVNPLQVIIKIASIIWLVGIGIMLLYAVISYLRLYSEVKISLKYRDNIYYCDNISSPFILGIIRPKIYIPSGLEENQIEFIIKHEKAHLKRLDHFWKPLSFLLLSVYWFNPFLWVAYILLCRDIELACDEKVIKNMDNQFKKEYSQTLADCGNQRRMIMVCPLAFGEVGVKDRIKSVLNYKKPAFWIILIAVIVSIIVAVCFLTNPQKAKLDTIINENGYTITEQNMKALTLSFSKASLPESIYTEGYEFEENEIVVYETETTKIYLEKVTPDNENDGKLYFYFNFSYDIGDGSGTILYPWTKNENGYGSTFNLTKDVLDCDNYSYPNAVDLRSQGPDNQVALYVDAKILKSAVGTIKIYVYCNEITYTEIGNQNDVSNDTGDSSDDKIDIIGESQIDEIDAEYEKRKSQINDNASLTNLNEEFAGIWKEKIEDYYNILIEHYSSKNDDNTVQKYAEEQNDWKKQYELKMAYYKNVYSTQYEMGTIVPMLLSDTNRVLNRDRAVELYQRCVMIQFDDIVDISSLAEKYPEYFYLPVENGLNLYVEVNDVGCYNYRCKLTSGDNNDISLLPEATFSEMQTILNQNYNQQNVTIRVYFSFKSLTGIGQFFGIYNLFNETSFKSNFGITACNIEYKTSLEETFYKLTYPLIENIEIENIIGGTKDENVATDQQLEFIYEDDHHAYFFPSLKGKNVVIYFRGGIAAVAADAIRNGDIPIMALDLWDIEYITKDKQDGVEYFMGRIEAVNYDSIFVKPLGGEWESFYNIIEIPKDTSTTDKNTEFKVGMVVEVEYKGAILEPEIPSPSNTIGIYILYN